MEAPTIVFKLCVFKPIFRWSLKALIGAFKLSLSRVWDDVWTTPNGDLLVELPQSVRLLHEGFPRLVIQSFPSGMWRPVNCGHLLVRECDHGDTGHLTSDIYIITTPDLMADMQAMFHNNQQCCTLYGEGSRIWTLVQNIFTKMSGLFVLLLL